MTACICIKETNAAIKGFYAGSPWWWLSPKIKRLNQFEFTADCMHLQQAGCKATLRFMQSVINTGYFCHQGSPVVYIKYITAIYTVY